MNLFVIAALFLLSSSLTSCQEDRDLTIACSLNLIDCQNALADKRSQCAPTEPAPSPSAPSPPTAPGTLVITGDNGTPASAFPMNLCEGDCDKDADCFGNLICFQRDTGNDVPGCIGVADSDGSDYCCDPSFDGCVSSEGGGGGSLFDQLLSFLNPIFDFFDTIFGIPSRRRALKEGNNENFQLNQGPNDRKLLFGLAYRECNALVDRCEQKLAEFSCPPTVAPTTLSPTKSQMPSPAPSVSPTNQPTTTPFPTLKPTKRPTKRPTAPPTKRPTAVPVLPPVNAMGMIKVK
jgi:hypothetical protein